MGTARSRRCDVSCCCCCVCALSRSRSGRCGPPPGAGCATAGVAVSKTKASVGKIHRLMSRSVILFNAIEFIGCAIYSLRQVKLACRYWQALSGARKFELPFNCGRFICLPCIWERTFAIGWARASKYKVPKAIEFLTHLPRYPNGKLHRREIRDRYWASASQSN